MNNLLAVQRAAASRDHGLHVQRPRHARPSRQHDNQLAAIASTILLHWFYTKLGMRILLISGSDPQGKLGRIQIRPNKI